MSHDSYTRGENPKSHHNQKRVEDKKVIIPVTCDKAQKKQIDRSLRHIKKGYKSQYIVQLMKKAIAEKNTNLYPKSKGDFNWQISLRPSDREIIYKWCSSQLGHNCRSRWITNLIVNH